MADKRAVPAPVRPCNAVTAAQAARLLTAGQLVAVPTETVYGLAARADSSEAVARIYAAKGRPDFNPLIVHVDGLETAERLALFDDRARKLAARFWPGPLTLVLPLKGGAAIAPAVTAGLPTIALRWPAHPAMQAILAAARLPLAAPSANPSGAVSPTTAAHVVEGLGERVALIVDGGPCTEGLESTIAALRADGTWQLLRPGPVTEAALSAVLGPASDVTAAGIEAPGQLAGHYSPGKSVRLNASERVGDEFLIGYGPVVGDVSLSRGGDLAEAAARLYDALHAARHSRHPRVAVAPVPDEGLGAAINDRLRRAAV
jgi:L-threonylcarbamoyladenylate synthase